MKNNAQEEWKQRSIDLLQAKLDNYDRLAKLTKHSKKKKRHLEGVQYYIDCIELAYEEYGWDFKENKNYRGDK